MNIEIRQLPRAGDADNYTMTIDGESMKFTVSACSLKVSPPDRRHELVFYAALKAVREQRKEQKAEQC